MQGAKKGALGPLDYRKLGISLGLGLIGFVGAWITTALVPALRDSGETWAILLAAGLPVAVNLIRKLLTDTTIPTPVIDLDGPLPPTEQVFGRDGLIARVRARIDELEALGALSPERAEKYRQDARAGSLTAILTILMALIQLLAAWRKSQ